LQAELDGTGYGKDVDSVHECLEMQKQMHQEILNFQTEIAECAVAKVCYDYVVGLLSTAKILSTTLKLLLNDSIALDITANAFLLLE
jgi:hypothetical protein